MSSFFIRDAYVVEDLVDESYLTWARKYYDIKFNVIKDYRTERSEFPYNEVVVLPFSRCYYNDALAQALLIDLTPKIEEIVKRKLTPTYTFCRGYEKGQRLVKHTDRPACEYSITLPITDNPWPIYLEKKTGESVGIVLKPGQGLVYKGRELPHYRGKLEEGQLIQLHLHYVDKNGPNAHWKYDKSHKWEHYAQSASFLTMPNRSK